MYLLQVQSTGFLEQWQQAATTTLGFFWMALWAFILGYIVSSMIQIFVTRQRMQESMGESGVKSVGLGAFFGFISSSCSFAALATTRALYQKGAGFIPAMSFLLASTNLVIELGIVIFIFLGLEFAAAEYIGGILLILFMWIFVTITYPEDLISSTRKKLDKGQDTEEDTETSWVEKIKSREGWNKVADQYWMEWGMVWKDVTIGFTVAGIVAVFVPSSFYETLFIGVGQASGQSYSFLQLLEHVLVGPVVAFFTFIGSMGNIPLAAVLYGGGVSFAGIMAFIFSDLVVFPVLRINAQYYGWKMSLYILLTLLFALVGSALILHYSFDLLGLLPQSGGKSMMDREFFKIDYTFFFNLVFLAISGVMAWLSWSVSKDEDSGHHHGGGANWVETILKYLAVLSYVWLAAGLAIKIFL
ncbi:MAG: permease [Balneolaceae bacterium]|nr:permease [Balneolaceae bacterium]